MMQSLLTESTDAEFQNNVLLICNGTEIHQKHGMLICSFKCLKCQNEFRTSCDPLLFGKQHIWSFLFK